MDDPVDLRTFGIVVPFRVLMGHIRAGAFPPPCSWPPRGAPRWRPSVIAAWKAPPTSALECFDGEDHHPHHDA